MNADALIALLELEPHPEGGHYIETYRQVAAPGARSAGTAIYYLLRAGEISHWHRIDASETWHFYAGSPLELRTSRTSGDVKTRILGNQFEQGERPQLVVEPGEWQAARSLGDFSLVGCTVAPGFDFAGFQLAASDWEP